MNDPSTITARTLGHYNDRARAFWEGTRDHDVTQNIDALVRHLPEGGRKILDLGCGPGRDVMALRAMGYDAVGLDGSEGLVAIARSNCPEATILHQDFLALDLEPGSFDGIYANASLFHVPTSHLPKVLGALRVALVEGGTLFSSNPRGRDEEGWNGARYGAYHSLEGWRGFMGRSGFVELEHYFRPAGQPRERQPWLASVWRVGS